MDDAGLGRALEPVGRAEAERLTEQLREVIGEARRVAVALAQRVRAAHRAQVWVALGYSGWGEYAQAEFGVSRAQAYRLIDIAESAGVLERAIGAAGVLAVSPAGDTEPVAGVEGWGLSQRALREVHGRLDELGRTVTEQLTAAGKTGQLDGPAVREIVHRCVDELRRPLPTAGAPAGDRDVIGAMERALTDFQRDPSNTGAGRRLVDTMAEAGGCLGRIALELAPAYLSEQEASEAVLARYAEDIGCTVETVLAARRYALTGDRRALEGTWL
ncbi:hypothetical protein GCM10010218_63940 [Streptomyces mashuensis]|uniref:Uncharacterized protein n=1 Tax=Streptomyces mashuensis TaxID=33904 RepID=A0A919EFJ2_9ACTN|nr:hypothetical protein GCM10010218_63940 [Streptomyces mashuensis]